MWGQQLESMVVAILVEYSGRVFLKCYAVMDGHCSSSSSFRVEGFWGKEWHWVSVLWRLWLHEDDCYFGRIELMSLN